MTTTTPQPSEKPTTYGTITTKTTSDESGVIDIKATFAPNSNSGSIFINLLILFFRIGSVLVSLAALIEGVIIFGKDRWIFMGFLTNWTLVYTLCFYQLPVLLFSLKPELTVKNNNTDDNDNSNNNNKSTAHAETTEIIHYQPSFLTKVTWASYSVASVSQITVTLVYWILLYSPEHTKMDYYDMTSHGFMCLLILIDGLIISVVPVRFKHIIFIFVYSICYNVWAILHAILGIGTSRDEEGKSNKSPLYDFLDFQNDPKGASIMTLGVILVVLPLVFLFVYCCSLFSITKNKCCFDGSRRKQKNVSAIPPRSLDLELGDCS